MIENLKPEQAIQLINQGILIDVRYPHEYEEKHIPNAINICLSEISTKANESLPDKDQLLLLYCRTGKRSSMACQILDSLGYTNLKNIGGILDWPYETE